MECNFRLKSYLWFQTELALRAGSILKSRVWFQTKLHSTQFNYHYLFDQPSWALIKFPDLESGHLFEQIRYFTGTNNSSEGRWTRTREKRKEHWRILQIAFSYFTKPPSDFIVYFGYRKSRKKHLFFYRCDTLAVLFSEKHTPVWVVKVCETCL